MQLAPPPQPQQALPDMDLTHEVICTSTDVHQQSLEAVFASARGQLHVPLFQRRYIWGPEQWAKLEADVQAATSSGGALFIGRVLTFVGPNDPRTLICDGQQRLITLTLLLAAVRDASLSDESPVPALADEIDSLLFIDGSSRRATVLVPTQEDRLAYAVALARPGEAPPSMAAVEPSQPATAPASAQSAAPALATPSAGDAITSAKRFLAERVRAALERHQPSLPASAADASSARRAEWSSRLRSLAVELRERVLLVVFKLDEGEELHRVFEQHANREKAMRTIFNFQVPGLQVSGADLVRNLLMSCVRSEAEQAQLHAEYWLEMERRATGGSGKPFDLESFFMSFLHSVGFSVGARPELYSGFRLWLAQAVLAQADPNDAPAVYAAMQGALQQMLAEAKKWEQHVHLRVAPA